MYVDVSMRAPDEGKIVRVLELDHDGNADHIGLIDRRSLVLARTLLREAIAKADEEGHPSFDETLAWRDLLYVCEEAAQ